VLVTIVIVTILMDGCHIGECGEENNKKLKKYSVKCACVAHLFTFGSTNMTANKL
jgi:hypothetical protein